MVLAGLSLHIFREAKYLFITVTSRRFTKKAIKQLEQNCRAAYAAKTSQSIFDANLPLSTIQTLYRTNTIIILLYDSPMVSSLGKLGVLGHKMLQAYMKKLLHAKMDLSENLFDIFCIRIIIPSLFMDLKHHTRMWTVQLGLTVHHHSSKKLQWHARESVQAISILAPRVPMILYFTKGRLNPYRLAVKEFERWSGRNLKDRKIPCVVKKVKTLELVDDILNSMDRKMAGKRCGWLYLLYRFPINTTSDSRESSNLLLLLKERLTRRQKKALIATLKEVYSRDLESKLANAGTVAQ